jgi:hypothetical protein
MSVTRGHSLLKPVIGLGLPVRMAVSAPNRQRFLSPGIFLSKAGRPRAACHYTDLFTWHGYS